MSNEKAKRMLALSLWYVIINKKYTELIENNE